VASANPTHVTVMANQPKHAKTMLGFLVAPNFDVKNIDDIDGKIEVTCQLWKLIIL
jgi:glycerol-3-phosphate dehydrogenase